MADQLEPTVPVPLSARLVSLLEMPANASVVSINEVLASAGSEGIHLLIILFCIPFLLPVSLPGSSTVAGIVIFVLSIILALRLTPRMPFNLGNRPVPEGLRSFLLTKGVRFLVWVEKRIRPRRSRWLNWFPVRIFNCALIMFLSVILSLPLPMIPFSNTLPAISIILLATAMLESDGVLIWWGYAASILSVFYFGLLAGLVIEVIRSKFGGIHP